MSCWRGGRSAVRLPAEDDVASFQPRDCVSSLGVVGPRITVVVVDCLLHAGVVSARLTVVGIDRTLLVALSLLHSSLVLSRCHLPCHRTSMPLATDKPLCKQIRVPRRGGKT